MAFDVEAYKAQTAPLAYDDLDFSAFERQPLSDGALRCLRYMCDVETYTVCYLRDLLVTPSHQDPVVTTFLTMWNYEEYWHGEALADVLAAHGVSTGDEHIRGVRSRNAVKSRLAPIASSVLGNAVGDDIVALQMSWGAINEWSTHAGYRRLADRESHPVLTELLGRIMQQETRHVAFYATQARQRLGDSSRARRLTRWALKRRWGPVGSKVMPPGDTRHLLRYLLGGAEGAKLVSQIDRHIDRLPGLDGLALVRTAAQRWGCSPQPA